MECKYTEWTSWNPACGKNMERKRTLQTIKKSVERESCSGLKTTCTGDAEQSEKKDELCKLILKKDFLYHGYPKFLKAPCCEILLTNILLFFLLR